MMLEEQSERLIPHEPSKNKQLKQLPITWEQLSILLKSHTTGTSNESNFCNSKLNFLTRIL